jgi:two-component system CheB/CheR fusion protein
VPLRDNAVATHLYRIAQEAVNNAVKHSQASLILVSLRTRDGRIELRVTDNGIGITASPSTSGGMGLHTMEYRTRTIGGTLSVATGPNGGTVVSCLAPLSTEERSP